MNTYHTVPRRALGAAIFALLILTTLAPVAVAAPLQLARAAGGIAAGREPAVPPLMAPSGVRAQSDAPTLSPADSQACKNYQLPSSPSKPFVDICSPEFSGTVEGPFGAHVVIVGQGFTGDTIQGVYLAPTKGFLALTIPCSSPLVDCIPFANNADSNGFQGWKDPFYEQFDWTFPPDKVKKDDQYAVVVSYKDAHQKVSQTESTASFKLLSDKQPCIFVSVEKPTLPSDGQCPESSVPQTFQGQVWIGGTGWLPDLSNSNLTEEILVQACASDKQQPCKSDDSDVFKPSQFAMPAHDEDDPGKDQPGAFLQQVSISTKGNGRTVFNIVAHNALDNPDPTDNANGALHFGDTANMSYVTLTITPAPCLGVSVMDHGKQQSVNCSTTGGRTLNSTSGDIVQVSGANWIPADAGAIQVQLQTSPCNGAVSPRPTAGKTSTPKPKPTATLPKSNDSLSPVETGNYLLLGDSVRPGGNPQQGAQSFPKTLPAQVSADGSLTASGTLPTVASATTVYVCAVDTSNPAWAVPAKGSNASGLQLKVMPRTTSKLQKLLLVLGGLFTLISLVVFVMTMPKRAVVPQPVGRRQ